MADVSGYTYDSSPGQGQHLPRSNYDNDLYGLIPDRNHGTLHLNPLTSDETPFIAELARPEVTTNSFKSFSAVASRCQENVCQTDSHDVSSSSSSSKSAEPDSTFKSPPSSGSGSAHTDAEGTDSVTPPGGSKKRTSSKRTVFSQSQLTSLENRFIQQSFLSRDERQDLAEQLRITERQVMVWFQNRRGRLKKRGPADLAYNPMKLNELNNRRPYPFLYGMLSSMHYQNNPYQQLWSGYPEKVKDAAASALDQRPSGGGKMPSSVTSRHDDGSSPIGNVHSPSPGYHGIGGPGERAASFSLPEQHSALTTGSGSGFGIKTSPEAGITQASCRYANGHYNNSEQNIGHYSGSHCQDPGSVAWSYGTGYPVDYNSGYQLNAYINTQTRVDGQQTAYNNSHVYNQPQVPPTNMKQHHQLQHQQQQHQHIPQHQQHHQQQQQQQYFHQQQYHQDYNFLAS